ncbi:MAG: FAD-dependent oxidoreductase [Gammaproteobacteria bacterium]|jgi:2,4-dienoyl-CoA reductase-like NADH-dependent reductase (Old Yellow Enzyme family)/NADPH-dependent 2,4-dienoyl-CoA reductase/sulfur reductase-like enzyme|nr:FAD-dependent oxidoreductase [Gammaproteobacteria bacterium]
MTQYKNLFQPLELRHRRLDNRIVFGAHTANMSDQGLPGERHRGYYEERAIGGAAMIVVEPMPVHATAVLTRGNFRHCDDEVVPYFRKITDAVHQHGTTILQQLYHVGQHGDSDLSFMPHWGPSGLQSYHDSDGSHAMRESEILEVIDCFTRAARRCQDAGFDGVDLFAAYHALLDQFWTPWSNRRDDRWGGSLENRCRLSMSIINSIRDACGEDFIIGLSTGYADNTPFVMTLEDFQEVIAYHDQSANLDYVSCGSGNYVDVDRIMPTFVYGEKQGVPLAAALKQVVKHAKVTAESHIRTPENADYTIASGDSDLVSIVRGQIADPHWVNKTRANRHDDIRGCISCNQMCWGRRSRDYWISCLVNPSAGREFEWGGDRFEKTVQPRKVLVVGAGPAGMEAARVAAERGHQVTLVEALGDLGGQFRLAGLAPRRGQVTELIGWYLRQFEQLGVEVRYFTPMDEQDIIEFGADEVVLATGSMPDDQARQRWLPEAAELPGLSNGRVFPCEEVFRDQAELDKSVIVIDEGGNWRGTGSAWFLAERGHEVTIVTPDPMIGKELTRTGSDFQIRANLAKLGARFMLESVVEHWHGDRADVRSLLDGSVTSIEASAIVTATTNVVANDIELALSEAGIRLHVIGDAAAPRQAPYAFHDGRKIGLAL